ncbi:DUF29 domain-containing protein [Pseudanabaena sp. SR411]|uniref:DUF29 domain-containing protein n=1 Tax=Pseudanabaena sp. SR411 TaxID=1980935 RepID=UPI00113FCE77|nr:DUF29 domain-containing protein [Pseudanabaena sp. SR411]
MTQTIAQKNSLYDRDLNLWLETAIAQLKAGDLKSLDIENLIEELEGLAGRDRWELKTRLATLIEHLLKRCYVKSEYDDLWSLPNLRRLGRDHRSYSQCHKRYSQTIPKLEK